LKIPSYIKAAETATATTTKTTPPPPAATISSVSGEVIYCKKVCFRLVFVVVFILSGIMLTAFQVLG